MAAAFVKSASGRGASPKAVGFVGNVTAGNLIVVAGIAEVSVTFSTVTDTQGNVYTLVRRVTVGTFQLEVWYAVNIAGGANTVTVTTSGAATLDYGVFEYSGVNGLDTSVSSNVAGSNPSIALTTTQNNEAIFGIIASPSAGPSAGAGFAARESNVFNIWWLSEDLVSNTAGSNPVTFVDAAGGNGVIGAAFKFTAPIGTEWLKATKSPDQGAYPDVDNKRQSSYFLAGATPTVGTQWLKATKSPDQEPYPDVSNRRQSPHFLSGSTPTVGTQWLKATRPAAQEPYPEVTNKRGGSSAVLFPAVALITSWRRNYKSAQPEAPAEVPVNKRIQSFYLPQGVPRPPSPFVGSPVQAKKSIPSFLNIRGDSQHIRASGNLAKIDPQVLSHALDSLQSYGDTTDNTLRGLLAQIADLKTQLTSVSANLTTGSFGIQGTHMPNPLYPAVYTINSAVSGDVDLYTVPVGRRAYFYGALGTNSSGGNVTVGFKFKIGGTYYQARTANNAIVSGQYGVELTTYVKPRVMDAGETLTVNMSAIGASLWLQVVEFDAVSHLRGVTLSSFSVGTNTLYTVPVGKCMFLPVTLAQIGLNTINYTNLSGADRTVRVYIVPQGSTPALSNLVCDSTVVPTGRSLEATGPLYGFSGLNVGDYISIYTDSAIAGQLAWVNVIEH